MLDILHQVEKELPKLLKEVDSWHTLLVDYHAPVVERVWRQWGDYRICLHKIYPCADNESLFHPHPWPSAMKVISGRYEMGVGYGLENDSPPVAATIIMGAGSEYEMCDPNGWHWVRPLDGPTMSLMVIGQPWDRLVIEVGKKLAGLTKKQKKEIVGFFKKYYC